MTTLPTPPTLTTLLTGSFWIGVLLAAVAMFGKWLVSEAMKMLARHSSNYAASIRFISNITPRLLRHKRLSGRWRISWTTDSDTFESQNSRVSPLYLALNQVFIEGEGRVSGGGIVPYHFIGTINSGETLITGNWFDPHNRVSGYSGAFQVRLSPAEGAAHGKWIGYSATGPIRTGDLHLERVIGG